MPAKMKTTEGKQFITNYFPILVGDMCQKSEDPCASFPCVNGATCTTLPDHEFSCSCDKGYSGRFCEHSEYLNVTA